MERTSLQQLRTELNNSDNKRPFLLDKGSKLSFRALTTTLSTLSTRIKVVVKHIRQFLPWLNHGLPWRWECEVFRQVFPPRSWRYTHFRVSRIFVVNVAAYLAPVLRHPHHLYAQKTSRHVVSPRMPARWTLLRRLLPDVDVAALKADPLRLHIPLEHRSFLDGFK